MSITAVVVFTSCGAVIGTAAGIKAIRSRETSVGTVALCSAGAVTVGAFMILQWLFWSSLDTADMRQVLMPDFFSPGRREKVLWWYAVASAGIAGLLTAACGWLRVRRGQA